MLTGLVKRIAPEARALPLDDPESPDGLSAVAVDVLLAAGVGTEQGGGQDRPHVAERLKLPCRPRGACRRSGLIELCLQAHVVEAVRHSKDDGDPDQTCQRHVRPKRQQERRAGAQHDRAEYQG